MSRREVHYLEVIIIGAALIIGGAAFFLLTQVRLTTEYRPIPSTIPGLPSTATSTMPKLPEIEMPAAITPPYASRTALVASSSPKIFAYAHGTVAADGKLFIGLANVAGNTFGTNAIVVFADTNDISKPTTIALPYAGDIQTMVYDAKHDKIYFVFSAVDALLIYSLDPQTYRLNAIVSTTSVNAGKKPAIVTDGTFIYGITNTDPATVFRANIFTGELTTSSEGHIAMGHSAALVMNEGVPELFFGGGMTNGFEKVNSQTLASEQKVSLAPCAITDDMPELQTTSGDSFIFVGCEMVPYGLRVDSKTLSYERFALPGYSLGFFDIGGDIYNAGRDGYLEIFKQGSLTNVERLKVSDPHELLDQTGTTLELNEILYSPESNRLFFTGWNGVRGLYELSTTSTTVENSASLGELFRFK